LHLSTTSLASTGCLTCCSLSQCLWEGLKDPKTVLGMVLEGLEQAQEGKSSPHLLIPSKLLAFLHRTPPLVSWVTKTL
jgi:hypothetical protein